MKKISYPSPNFNDRPPNTKIDILVLHYTGMPTSLDALNHMCNPKSRVSSHYMVDMDGEIYQLVSEQNRAWHAGISCWRGNSNINDRSIGIELENPGHEFGYQRFPDKQIDSLIELAKEIINRHSIPARNVIGHSDISPSRKKDPGELFDWHKLASHGIGCWPFLKTSAQNCDDSIKNFTEALKKYGYEVSDLTATTRAFQSHFMPNSLGEGPNIETYKLLQDLINTVEQENYD